MGFLISDVTGNITEEEAPTAVSIVGSEKATTPPTETNNTGFDIAIPVPTNTQDGDLLLAGTVSLNSMSSVPSGWSQVVQVGQSGGSLHIVWKKVAGPNEPSSYTWTVDAADELEPRSGNMISLRNASSTIGDSASAEGTFTFPDVTNNSEGAMFLGFAGDTTNLSETISVDSPLTLQTQHVHDGDSGYNSPRGTGIVTEDDVSNGTVSGRSFSDPNGSQQRPISIIVETGA